MLIGVNQAYLNLLKNSGPPGPPPNPPPELLLSPETLRNNPGFVNGRYCFVSPPSPPAPPPDIYNLACKSPDEIRIQNEFLDELAQNHKKYGPIGKFAIRPSYIAHHLRR